MKKSTKKSIIHHYYNEYNEKDRLASNWGQLECIRTKEIIEQYLPEPPQKILDVGGGTGAYAFWLANKGYKVHLIDPVPKHIEQAKQLSKQQSENANMEFQIGDARRLNYKDCYADILLLMGPLYHLLTYSERIAALKESYRILKKDGLLFAVGISRFASCVDGFMSGYFKDPEFRKIMRQDVKNGQHRNHTDNELYFTDAYFHHPEEFRSEITTAGFNPVAMHAVEGIGYMLKDFDQHWNNEEYREFLLHIIRHIDTDSSIIGASLHIMCVASKM